MKKNTHKKNQGFTLIETIVYIALSAMVISGTLSTTYQLMRGSDRYNEQILISEEANFVVKKINWAITGLTSITVPAAGASGATLQVNKNNFIENPLIVDLNGTDIRLKRGVNAAVVLQNDRLKVTDLLFTHEAATADKPAQIKVSFKMNNQPFALERYVWR